MPGLLIFGRKNKIVGKTGPEYVPVTYNLVFPQRFDASLPESAYAGGCRYGRHRLNTTSLLRRLNPRRGGESKEKGSCTFRSTGWVMITIFQHGEHESSGEIWDISSETKPPFWTERLFETGEGPGDPAIPAYLLGGPMSINDTGDNPFFAAEKQVIRKMVAQKKPGLGICLGAQMIASAFGEWVFPLEEELGWCQVHGCGPDAAPHFPASFTVFHWHYETFNLPQGATLLSVRGYGEKPGVQARQCGRRAVPPGSDTPDHRAVGK